MKKLTKGFTLIELLVVIAIIGVLSSVVLAALSSARTKGMDSAIISTLKNAKTQSEIYYTYNGNYGTNSAAVTSPAKINCTDAGFSTTLFGLPTTTKGSLLQFIPSLQTKAGTGNFACGVYPVTSGATVTAWALSAQLKGSSDFYCVDSFGNAKIEPYTATTLDDAAKAISTTGSCK